MNFTPKGIDIFLNDSHLLKAPLPIKEAFEGISDNEEHPVKEFDSIDLVETEVRLSCDFQKYQLNC